MSASIILLIQKLREIKESLGERDLATIHCMVTEAEEHALCLQRESPEHIRRESRHGSERPSTR